MNQNRFISPEMTPQEDQFEGSLRPRTLEEYVGQQKIKENLKIFIQAAKMREEALDHCLFYGPPGLGKTTLAYLLSREMGVNIVVTSGPVIEKPGDLAAILTNLQPRDVLFIDEIHRLHPVLEEVLYPAMEDYQLDIMIGQGPAARSVRLNLPPFTLVGATTRAGLLSSPLRDRFGFIARLEYYNFEELETILQRSSRILNIKMDDGGSAEIAKRSRGTPRIANRLLKRVRDFADVIGKGVVTKEISDEGLSRLDVDKQGLDQMDRAILRTIIDKFDGGPVGIETLCSALSEEPGTLEDVYEPYLIQQGYLSRTARGRMATARAYNHFGLKPSPEIQKQATLFETTLAAE